MTLRRNWHDMGWCVHMLYGCSLPALVDDGSLQLTHAECLELIALRTDYHSAKLSTAFANLSHAPV